MPFERRGKRADEYMEALKAVWSGHEVDYQGEFVNWQGFMMRPRPAQPGGIPLVVGGVTPPAIRRTVKYGDGWYVIGKDLNEIRAHMQAFNDECARQGRDPGEPEITAYWNFYREGPESLKAYEELGIHRLLINVPAMRQQDAMTGLQYFAGEVVAQHG
ncbi:MAG: hypothetical protein ETSY2_21305 [Candidatus Entotheonella gemina]|uniref:Luciferase-like domain-containing protein n=1 Tax=Candidatus Entotheonella gemina TaxID=1429439 RepID=W4M6B3_9BACT|nr:MAG: hypothetical protein ETSY2_21305 [Candidatus Entotheonella gemina]